jgi:hypothetical protein
MKYIVQYAALAMAMLCGTAFLSGFLHLLGTYDHTRQHFSSPPISLSETLFVGGACLVCAKIYQLMVRAKSDPISKTQTQIKVRHMVYLLAWLCVLFMVHTMNLRQRTVSSGLLVAFVFATAAAIWSGFVLRKTLFKKSVDALPNNVGEALNRWKGAHLIGFNNAMSIAVFGAVLKFMGTSWYVAGIFFGLSLVFLLLWGPRQMAAQTVLNLPDQIL